MKTLLRFLSDNRKFITAFLGLYVAYSVGFNQGISTKAGDSQNVALVQGDKQEVNTFGEGISPNPTAVDFNQAPESSSTPTVNHDDKNTTSLPSPTVTSGSGGKIETKEAKVTPSPSATPGQSMTTKTINASGKYSYMGQDVTYNLAFKNTGGSVSGTVGGVCEGKVDGDFDGRAEGGDISGTVKGSCGMGFLSKKLDAKYSGKVYLNRGIMNITVSGEIPFVEGDQSFSLSFDP